ncbi:hypothetical protein E2P84_15835 [Burkholderia cepacia]|uniref:Uncharacterized protein n=1 Tax=Burkholderia cepacia TaxID=292 RepID=A0AAX2RI43_BURCE|nr:hypothetical protein [Burkholderia cepacia]TES75991.1 hypothetical protein E2P84_15835 [Burkholderia cepacia]TET00042.1 hypothetical protein E3D36_22865 [Burkholderia cepacia]TEU38412.1 hypothetical protein E3D39_22890 [Burkholderia cepacia]TEU42208.1 hypothetical protein E3D37_25340 [Burkholderia cepacia]TEU49622.1 hypothetical protein E3D38_19930 [Burkholderia cepacia]
MNKKILTALSLCAALPGVALAQSIAAPTLKPGDTWTYINTVEIGPNGWRQSRDEVTVQRTTPGHIYIETRQSGTTQAPHELIVDADWSRARSVNGTETVVNRPFAFPLTVGKTWAISYAETNPNPQHASEAYDTHYKVVGRDTITVQGGKFDAIKIEAEGTWKAQNAPGQSITSGLSRTVNGSTILMQSHNNGTAEQTGKTYKAFWYVPAVGRWVKSVEEYYDSNSMRTARYTNELVSYRRAGTEGGAPLPAQPAPAPMAPEGTPPGDQ